MNSPTPGNGQIHHNGSVTDGLVTGVRPVERTLTGPGFTVGVAPADDGTLAITVTGRPAPEQVLRLIAAHDVLAPPDHSANGRIDVELNTTHGTDRYVYTADLRHRLLFTRAWDQDGIAGVFYGLNPFVADTDGDPADVPPRPSFRNAVGAFATLGPVSRVDIMNVFTLRTRDAATLPADPADRVAIPQLERDVLQTADVVMPAWGAKATAHQAAIADLFGLFGELGITPKLRAKDGVILTSGSPAQPTHTRMGGYHDIALVDAPSQWLHGGPLDSHAGVADQRDAPADNAPSDAASAPRPSTTVDEEPASRGETGASWRSRQPQPLIEELQDAGLPERRARTVAGQIKDWAADGRYQPAIDATKLLLKGEVPILLDEGETEAALWEILPKTLTITTNAREIAQSLLVGSVCSGGVGEYASWLELQEPGANARHKSREAKYPVPGIHSPGDARMAYSRLIGRRSEGAARKARGHASTLNAKSNPTPQERYGWGV